MKTATAVQAQVVGGVGHLVLDQPDRRNAMTAELVDEAIAAHDDFAASGVKVGLLSATGPVFSAGGDLKAKRIPGVPPAGVRLIETFDSSPILWVAAVHGPAIGAALHLLSTCATVVIADDAWYRVPEFLHGRYPRPVVAALAEIIGPRRALRMATTGEKMPAEEAFGLGLVEHVVPPAELMDTAWERARALADTDPSANALTLANEAWRSRLGTRPLKGASGAR
ncbi:enoyl-CoA hydratase/isomerase family protein [Streptomyces sp. NPDC001315]|uniref:enoyl-CoA hydratase/isomerase family protein n=1 Tax=Streptomyces sp. NPDC001315 TaxID=3364562 RepID=UPI0036A47D82